jgi:hypothetical protein
MSIGFQSSSRLNVCFKEEKATGHAFAEVCGLTSFTLDVHDSRWRRIRACVFQSLIL